MESVQDSMKRKEWEENRMRVPATMVASGIWLALIGGLLGGWKFVVAGLGIITMGVAAIVLVMVLESKPSSSDLALGFAVVAGLLVGLLASAAAGPELPRVLGPSVFFAPMIVSVHAVVWIVHEPPAELLIRSAAYSAASLAALSVAAVLQ